MDKQEFNKLAVLEQIKYINNTLSKGESLRSISSNLRMSKTTIRDRFFKLGYVFNRTKRQYIKDDSINSNSKYSYNTNILKKDKTIENKSISTHEYKSNIDIFSSTDTKNKMIDILNKYDDLIKMMEWYNNQKNIIEPVELKIDNSKLSGEVKTTTVRLYSDIWNDFREFMEGYKEFKSMDLISMALVEFMQKYKK